MKRTGALLVLALLATLACTHRTLADPAPGPETTPIEPAPAPTPAQPRLGGWGDPQDWTPQDAYDLTGPVPADKDIRAAIAQGIDYVLSEQDADGSWDVTLSGAVLSQVADQALDAVCVTALAGMALTPHAALDARIEPALNRAAEFIVDRIMRGKLSYRVDYAVWRYTLSTQFLVSRFKASQDAARRELYKATAKRCINALLRMQLSNGERSLLDDVRRSRVDATLEKARLPGRLGLVLALPSEADHRDGAPITQVVEGSPAAKAGLAAGDRVLAIDGVPVNNAVDYYDLELDFLQGQSIKVGYRKADGKSAEATIALALTWPVFTGIVTKGEADQPPVIERFLHLSPALKAGLEVDDKIVAVGDSVISTHSDFEKAVAALKAGSKVTVKVDRAGAAKAITFAVNYAPAGTLDIFGLEEDKSGGEGVAVRGYMPQVENVRGYTALARFPGFAALRLGIKVGDRITHIGDTPVTGLDHFLGLASTIAAGVPVRVRWQRGDESLEGMALPDVASAPGNMDIGFPGGNGNLQLGKAEPRVMQVIKGGAGEKAGLQPGDLITSIDGKPTPDRKSIAELLVYYTAGDVLKLGLTRKGTATTLDLRLSFPSESPVEEGGWAYYPRMGESTSHSTTAALLALYEARDVMGFAIPKRSLAAAERLITGLRVTDPNNASIETYLYRGEAKQFAGALAYFSDVRGTVGRICICELQQYKAGLRTKDHVRKAVEVFLKNRDQLDYVRDYWHTHLVKLYQNAAYYWMFGHTWALVAAREAGPDLYKRVNEVCLKALMMDRQQNGRWLDHESFGEFCGTCQALIAFGETEGGFRK